MIGKQINKQHIVFVSQIGVQSLLPFEGTLDDALHAADIVRKVDLLLGHGQ